jgi:hypothetical protein
MWPCLTCKMRNLNGNSSRQKCVNISLEVVVVVYSFKIFSTHTFIMMIGNMKLIISIWLILKSWFNVFNVKLKIRDN